MRKTKVTIRTVLVFLLAFVASSHAEYSGGSGTAAEPYEIGTVADWQELMETAGDWDRHFVLIADLDMGGVAMSPVGNEPDNFTGVFDSEIERVKTGQK